MPPVRESYTEQARAPSYTRSVESALREAIERDGFVIVPELVVSAGIEALAAALEKESRPGRAGRRNVLRNEAVRRLAAAGPVRDAAAAVLGPGCGAVRAILFDKNADANWHVVWHQDTTVAVEAKVSAVDYGPWSVKDGVPHVRPPLSVLEAMAAVRLHLDACREADGPLNVLPASHRTGFLAPEAIDAWRSRAPAYACVVERGGLLVMRPLLLHASPRTLRGNSRRILHVEYGPPALPGGVRWHEWVGPAPA
jgi:Phytanoyl-CoA dioxygenase (PhyH)